MIQSNFVKRRRGGIATMGLAAVMLVLPAAMVSAKTPDGAPPAVENVCSSLTGAAFGLCNAYCEAQDCDTHLRPSCNKLRANYRKLTGNPFFPCDLFCGDGRLTPPEQCDPPGSTCPDGQPCNPDCSCPEPLCGNGRPDPGEECEPGATCGDGQPCNRDCTCPEPLCGNGQLDPGEECDPPGSGCDSSGTCSPDCTCRGPSPECQGATCDTFTPCNPGTPCPNPVCVTTAEGGGLCVEGSTQCGGLAPCITSADCQAGEICAVQTCCVNPVCIPTPAFCPAP